MAKDRLVNSVMSRKLVSQSRQVFRNKARRYDTLASKQRVTAEDREKMYSKSAAQFLSVIDDTEELRVSAFPTKQRTRNSYKAASAPCDISPEVRETWQQKLHKNEQVNDNARAELRRMASRELARVVVDRDEVKIAAMVESISRIVARKVGLR